LLGKPQKKHDYLYWEFHEGGTKQAVLIDQHWKVERMRPDGQIEVYDLATDEGESHDLHHEHPELVQRAEELFKTARTDNPDWPIRMPPAGKKAAPAKQ
jgi:hypothetical protein